MWKLTSELSTCHDTISNLRNENIKLIAKVEKLNVCDDSLVKLRNDNASLISKIDKWKGNVPLGHFYNVLVIKCPTHIKWVDYVPNRQEVKIM